MNSSPAFNPERNLDAQRDSLDFRDLIYRPALVTLKPELFPNRDFIHIMDQGTEGGAPGSGWLR